MLQTLTFLSMYTTIFNLYVCFSHTLEQTKPLRWHFQSTPFVLSINIFYWSIYALRNHFFWSFRTAIKPILQLKYQIEARHSINFKLSSKFQEIFCLLYLSHTLTQTVIPDFIYVLCNMCNTCIACLINKYIS